MERKELLTTLSDGFAGFKTRSFPKRDLVLWVLISLIACSFLMVLTQAFRFGFGEQLLLAPRFLLESLLLLSVVVLAGYEAILRSLPDRNDALGRISLGFIAFVLFLAVLAFSFVKSPLEPSLLGKRDHCLVEGVVFGSLCFAAFLLCLRKLAAFDRRRTACLAGLASASVPAFLMQFACMYEPYHNLLYHFSPVAILFFVGVLIGPFVLRKI